jgi:hypothetical protein
MGFEDLSYHINTMPLRTPKVSVLGTIIAYYCVIIHIWVRDEYVMSPNHKLGSN